MNPQAVWCPNLAWPASGQTGQGNSGVHSQTEQRYRLCKRRRRITIGAATKVPSVLHLPPSLLSWQRWHSRMPRKSCVFEIV